MLPTREKGGEAPNSTQAFLHAHGIRVEPEALDKLVCEAVARLSRGLYPPDPRSELSPAEVRVLEEGGFDLSPEQPGEEDPLARTAAEYAALLKTSLTVADAAKRLGLAAGGIRRRLSRKPPAIFGIRLASGWHIPQFQFAEDSLLPGLAEILAKLDPEHHPVTIQLWFTTPNPELIAKNHGDRHLSPRDWLRLGFPPATVAELADVL